MREFIPPRHAITTQAAIDIAAAPQSVAALYRNVEKWGETFPATIAKAQVIQTGDNWVEVAVSHKNDGRVPNTLIFLSDTEVGLEESKKRFDAKFLNKFEPAVGGGTHYVITAYISPKGFYRILKPFLGAYVRRQALHQMNNYVLEPLKTAAEKARLEKSPQ